MISVRANREPRERIDTESVEERLQIRKLGRKRGLKKKLKTLNRLGKENVSMYNSV